MWHTYNCKLSSLNSTGGEVREVNSGYLEKRFGKSQIEGRVICKYIFWPQATRNKFVKV